MPCALRFVIAVVVMVCRQNNYCALYKEFSRNSKTFLKVNKS